MVPAMLSLFTDTVTPAFVQIDMLYAIALYDSGLYAQLSANIETATPAFLSSGAIW